MKCVKVDDDEDGGVCLFRWCLSVRPSCREMLSETQCTVWPNIMVPVIPVSLSFILSLLSGTAVLPAPMGNGPHIYRGLVHMHRHTAIAQELAHACTRTKRKHIATFRHKRKSKKLIQTQSTRHTLLPLNCNIFNLESVLI